MSSTSTIEWTEATWNPVTGCTKVSPGCAHCYAETFAERFRGVPGHPYEQGFDLKLWPERLPLQWKRPRTIFVNRSHLSGPARSNLRTPLEARCITTAAAENDGVNEQDYRRVV